MLARYRSASARAVCGQHSARSSCSVLADVTRTTERSSRASTAACSLRANSPRTIGATLARVIGRTRSSLGNGAGARADANVCARTASIRASRLCALSGSTAGASLRCICCPEPQSLLPRDRRRSGSGCMELGTDREGRRADPTYCLRGGKHKGMAWHGYTRRTRQLAAMLGARQGVQSGRMRPLPGLEWGNGPYS